MQIAIEAKAVARITSDHLKGLRALKQDHPKVRRRILVCLERKRHRTEDGILVMPAREFCERLSAGEIF
jgi:hypothetical protein